MADLADIATETVRILKDGHYVAPSGRRVSLERSLQRSIEGVTVARGIPPETDGTQALPTVEVTTESSAVAIQRVGGRSAVLNFANAFTPGGGFLRGARAQEEQLCRCSTLYPSLVGEAAAPFFDEQVAANTALGLDHVITTPDVVFFRGEDFAFLESGFVSTVLTCAAPNLGAVFAATDSGLEPETTDDALVRLLRGRVRAIIAAATATEVDHLVLGAWGCGAFGNDPVVVADAFADALRGTSFASVVFAIYRGPPENLAAFQARFPSLPSS